MWVCECVGVKMVKDFYIDASYSCQKLAPMCIRLAQMCAVRMSISVVPLDCGNKASA